MEVQCSIALYRRPAITRRIFFCHPSLYLSISSQLSICYLAIKDAMSLVQIQGPGYQEHVERW